ncbi:putative zinc-binding protein [Motiliproteus sp. MSK22-1]|uniref:putative zinc-binding protein n=1 Tax=Motiliproteus sp. MSK22-1 TaxID=1897630 RepID=UPI000976DF08|nr:putative zinc-binding protein [Motiliproteus sp. MSK22-1]OMH39117.1 zinc-binding protein [Motiliproteus sp. MSK22-1]
MKAINAIRTQNDNSTGALPLIYSCSGCSNIAQLANQVAIELFREGQAEMSCIAGVGGGVKNLVKVAKSGRPIISLDGCPLHCVKNCLNNHGIESTYHYTLTKYGIKKRPNLDFDPVDVKRIKAIVVDNLVGSSA